MEAVTTELTNMLRLHVFFMKQEIYKNYTGAHENELIAVYLIGENEPVLNTISLTIRRKISMKNVSCINLKQMEFGLPK